MAMADVGGLRIEYERAGSGEPLLLIQPSWWPLDPWLRHQVPAFASAYDVIAFNLRGLGASEATLDGYTLEQFADDASGLLETLGKDRAHVLGFALGGATALTLAHRHPQRVGALVVAAVGSGGRAPDGVATAVERTRAEVEPLGPERYVRHHAENDDFAFSAAFYREHPEEVAALSDALWARETSMQALLQHAGARATYELDDWVGEVEAPTLLLVGGEDRVRRGRSTPLETARWLAGRMPRARLVEFPGVKHMLFWEAPAATNEAVLGLLRSNSLS